MSVGLRCGVYEHYKGKKYLLLGVARHTETGELMAVYVPLYEPPGDEGVQMSVRPLEMFVGGEVGSELRPRFRFTDGGAGQRWITTARVRPGGYRKKKNWHHD